MNQFFWRPHGPAKTRHFQRTNLADPEASLVLVPAFIMEPPALSLLTPLHREPDLGPGCAGVHLADGFTLLEAETPPPKKSVRRTANIYQTFDHFQFVPPYYLQQD